MAHPPSREKRLRVLRLHAMSPELTASQIGLRVGLATRTVQRILESWADQKQAGQLRGK